MKPFVRDLYWFPKRHLSMMAVKKNFTVTLYEDAEEEEIIQVYRERTIKGEPWIGLPRGQPQLVKSCLLSPVTWKKLVDKRTNAPLKKFPLKFQSEFRDYQPAAISALSKAIGGVLKSAPRTGKCVVGDTLICTNRGFIRAGAFRVIDAVLQGCEITGRPSCKYRLPTHTGDVKCVSGVYSYTKETEVVTVKTNRGFEITCTPDEAFMTSDGEWVKAKDLRPDTLR